MVLAAGAGRPTTSRTCLCQHFRAAHEPRRPRAAVWSPSTRAFALSVMAKTSTGGRDDGGQACGDEGERFGGVVCAPQPRFKQLHTTSKCSKTRENKFAPRKQTNTRTNCPQPRHLQPPPQCPSRPFRPLWHPLKTLATCVACSLSAMRAIKIKIDHVSLCSDSATRCDIVQGKGRFWGRKRRPVLGALSWMIWGLGRIRRVLSTLFLELPILLLLRLWDVVRLMRRAKLTSALIATGCVYLLSELISETAVDGQRELDEGTRHREGECPPLALSN